MNKTFGRTSGLLVILTGALTPTPVQAQSSSGSYSDLPDRFQIELGGFRIATDTKLKYSLGGAPASEIDFESELDVPDSASTVWLDGTWRVGRRHQVKLNFTRSSRTGAELTLRRDIVWGDQAFEAGVTASAETSADILTGYYRFALVRNDRFEAGPAIGLGHLSLDATIRGTATVDGGGGRTVAATGDTGSVTGDVGGYFTAWLAPRVSIRGDLLYIIVKPGNSEASVTDGRIGLNWYPWKNVGLGAQYKYYKYRYERDVLSTALGGSLTYRGAQLYASFLF